MLGILLTASAVIGLVAFINSQQNRGTTPTYEPPAEPAAEAPPAEASAPVTEAPPAAPAEAAPPDYSYMNNWTDEDLRLHAESYQPGYAEAASILASRKAGRELSAYYDAQGSITRLVRFVRDWSSGSLIETARSDLQSLIQGRKYYSDAKVWVRNSGTYAYRSPSYEATSLPFNSTSGSWPTTGTISNEDIIWVEMPVSYQGQDIKVYVPQSALSYTDPNYRAPSPPPPPPPPPAPRYTPPPQTYSTAPAPAPAPTYVTIGSRRWADEPSDSQFRKISESMRIRNAISITVDCAIGYDYQLTGCQVVSPGNLTDRQWDGVLDLAELYTAPQYSADGYSTQGKRVTITFDFDP